jgi:hypothetical protein
MIFSRPQILKALFLLFLPVGFVSAHIPLVITQTNLHDITEITHPEISQAFYGKLDDKPHTYEIRNSEPFLLSAALLLPDIEGVSRNVAVIVIKETGRQGEVREVTRILGKDAAWESFFEPWGGDRYLRGGVFSSQVDEGVYRIEVSAPDNQSPYVLVIGSEEKWGDVGYFEMLGRIRDVKVFFGKSKFSIIESPLTYVPLLILFLGIAYLTFRRGRKSAV